ncbi:MAG TPA: glycosyltransferase family 4 protein [Mucilaginibacter sp.]|jgi:glycosyltransferase involved in cell wall biosynthesis
MPDTKKLIYILNHYSKNSEQHFFHITNLLFEIASRDVKIILIIEKCDDEPVIDHPNIKVIPQRKRGKLTRPLELFGILKTLVGEGFTKVFIRISSSSALVAIAVSYIYNLEVYYWHSGTVKEFNDALPFGKRKIKNYIKSALPFNIIKNYATWFVTGPESMKDYYIKECGIKPSKIIVLYNDIDLKRFNPLTPADKLKVRQQLGIEPKKKIILFVHRFSPVRKSLFYIPYIFEQFYKHPNSEYEILLIGDGSEKNEIERKILSAGLQGKVKVLGGKPNSIIQDYYNIADIFINPTYTEGFPRVLIEAMAIGLPIVTTDAGGIKDILGNKQKAFMVAKDNLDGFASKLMELTQSSPLMEELREENLLQVKRFSTPNVAQMYINLIFRNE